MLTTKTANRNPKGVARLDRIELKLPTPPDPEGLKGYPVMEAPLVYLAPPTKMKDGSYVSTMLRIDDYQDRIVVLKNGKLYTQLNTFFKG